MQGKGCRIVIGEANRSMLQRPARIYPGQMLRLPAL
jgi:nucleoid-associated protein YgaU